MMKNESINVEGRADLSCLRSPGVTGLVTS